MASSVRTWIIRTPDDAVSVWMYLKENAKKFVEAGHPLQVVMSRYRATRSNEANAYMWAGILTPAAEQIPGNFSPESINIYLKRKFLPDTCAKGLDKWLDLPDGTRELVMSTSDLNVEEMSLYLEEVQAHLVSEYGVHLPENPNNHH